MDYKFFSKHIIASLVIAIVGILCLFGQSPLLTNIGSVLLVSGIYSFIDQLLLKQSLIDMVVQKVGLKKQIDEAGLVSIGCDLSDIKYAELLPQAKHSIDIVHNYARTWTSSNYDYIRKAVLDRRCAVRVVLLNPDSPFTAALEGHYKYEPHQLVSLIHESTDRWRELYQELEQARTQGKKVGSLKLYYFNGQPAFSLYRMDEKLVVVSIKNSNTKSIYLPYTIYEKKPGGVYDTYLSEIEAIIAAGTEVDLSGEAQ